MFSTEAQDAKSLNSHFPDAPAVTGSPDLSEYVGEVRPLSITQRDRLIQAAGKEMEAAMARYETSGCFSDRGAADYWRVTMEADIRARNAILAEREDA